MADKIQTTLIEDVENGILERLQSKVKDVQIEPFPDKPSEYKLLHPKGALLVSFSGSVYSDSHATDVIVQDRNMEFDITIVTRNLRGHQGSYTLLEAARIALTGYKIAGGSKMYPKKEGFLSEENKTWQYGIRFALTTCATEMDEDEQLPLLEKITAVDDYGGVEVS